MTKVKEQHEELYQELLDEVVSQIHQDILDYGTEAIEELLKFCPIENLIGYLPEEKHDHFKKLLK